TLQGCSYALLPSAPLFGRCSDTYSHVVLIVTHAAIAVSNCVPCYRDRVFRCWHCSCVSLPWLGCGNGHKLPAHCAALVLGRRVRWLLRAVCCCSFARCRPAFA